MSTNNINTTPTTAFWLYTSKKLKTVPATKEARKKKLLTHPFSTTTTKR